nr:MAG TPA: cytochrome c2 [Caudoviricetes sp.]
MALFQLSFPIFNKFFINYNFTFNNLRIIKIFYILQTISLDYSLINDHCCLHLYTQRSKFRKQEFNYCLSCHSIKIRFPETKSFFVGLTIFFPMFFKLLNTHKNCFFESIYE